MAIGFHKIETEPTICAEKNRDGQLGGVNKKSPCQKTGALRGAGDGLLSRVLSDGVPSAL